MRKYSCTHLFVSPFFISPLTKLPHTSGPRKSSNACMYRSAGRSERVFSHKSETNVHGGLCGRLDNTDARFRPS